MSMYGVELVSNSGHKFVIPDSNPFTFHEKYRVEVNNYGSEVNTGISASSKTMMFVRIAGGDDLSYIARNIDLFVKNGTWHIYGYSVYWCIFEVYLFTDREYKDVNGAGYGVQIFDAEGNQIIGCNSKPLKMKVEQYKPSSSSLWTPLGYPAAVTPSIVKTNKWSFGLFLDPGSVYTVVGEDDGYSQTLKEIGTNENRIQYDSTNYPQFFLSIDTREYA